MPYSDTSVVVWGLPITAEISVTPQRHLFFQCLTEIIATNGFWGERRFRAQYAPASCSNPALFKSFLRQLSGPDQTFPLDAAEVRWQPKANMVHSAPGAECGHSLRSQLTNSSLQRRTFRNLGPTKTRQEPAHFYRLRSFRRVTAGMTFLQCFNNRHIAVTGVVPYLFNHS